MLVKKHSIDRHAHLSLSGRVKWTLFDSSGKQELGGHWNSNLITNYGLDAFGNRGSQTGSFGAIANCPLRIFLPRMK